MVTLIPTGWGPVTVIMVTPPVISITRVTGTLLVPQIPIGLTPIQLT